VRCPPKGKKIVRVEFYICDQKVKGFLGSEPVAYTGGFQKVRGPPEGIRFQVAYTLFEVLRPWMHFDDVTVVKYSTRGWLRELLFLELEECECERLLPSFHS